MKKILLLTLLLAAAWPAAAAIRSVLQISTAPPVTSTVDLNFATSTATGCADVTTSCLTFTRATAETCKDSSGNITYVTSGNPCITTAGLQVWEASTNNITHSAQDSGWTLFNLTAAIDQTPPDAVANTATTLTETTANAQHDVQSPTFSFVSGTTYITSCFVKQGTVHFAQLTQNSGVMSGGGAINIDLTTGTTGTVGTSYTGGSEAYANGWYRLWAKWAATSSTSASVIIAGAQNLSTPRLQTYTGIATNTIFYWGCQIETTAGMTPYIPTTTVAVTRNAMNVQAAGSSLLETTLNAATGTVVANTNAQASFQSAIAASIVSGNGVILLGKTTGGNLTTAVGATLTTSNTATWTGAVDSGLAWNASGGILELAGGTQATDAQARTPATTFKLGSTSGSSAFFDGNITRLQVYNTKLSTPQ